MRRPSFTTPALALALLLPLARISGVTPAVQPEASAAARFASVPLFFEANQGQAPERAQFIARGVAHSIFLHSEGASILLSEPGSGATAHRRYGRPATDATKLVEMQFVGARPEAMATATEAKGRVNYFTGSDSSRWVNRVKTFSKVRYESIYPGIDLVYYGNQQRLEFDFVVAPGADPSVIRLQYAGHDRLEVDVEGNLLINAGNSRLRQDKPIVYQVMNGKRHEISGTYRQLDSRTVTFELASYDRSLPLVIDPVLDYSAYLGGGQGDVAWGIAVDVNGSAYIAGTTRSKNLPIAGDGTNYAGGTPYGGDAFVARLDFDPETLELTMGYFTYLGGNIIDGASAIAVDNAGNAYVTGYTQSTNFPAVNNTPAAVLQSQIAGTNLTDFNVFHTDAFVTKLNPNGGIVYSTYLGGELDESGADIAVDSAGNVYVVGLTESALVSRATNWVQTTKCTNDSCGPPISSTNTVLTRLILTNTILTNVTKTTASKTNYNIVETTFLGATNLTLGFTNVGAFQTNNAGGNDLFITKISPDGSSVIFSSYLGGLVEDYAVGVAVDDAGNIAVAGWTESSDLAVTNALQSARLGSRDGLLAKIDPSGGLVYLTYFGGTGRDAAYSVALDGDGAAYFAGLTGSTDFPSTPGALNRGGVFGSADAGANWAISSAGLRHTTVNALTADSITPGTFYAGTPRGVFKTVDGGATWSEMATGLTTRAVLSLAVDPADSSIVYAGTSVGLFTSTNAGINWVGGDSITVTNDGVTNSIVANPGLPLKAVRAIYIDPVATSNVFAGTAQGIFLRTVSTNEAGNEWVALNKGLGNKSVFALAASPASPELLFAGTDGGVFISTNRGTNWRGYNAGLKSTRIRSLVVDPADSAILYAGTLRGFHKSVDLGTNWIQFTNGIGRPAVNALALDPAASTTLYAGATNGLFKSVDAGTNWVSGNAGLDTRDVNALVLSPSVSGALLAGTRGTNFAGGTNDAFLAKLSTDGSALEYAFTFGGTKNDEAWDVAVDGNRNAFVTGQTASKNFPAAGILTNVATGNTNFTGYLGKIDAFVAGFDSAGSNRLFSFFLGGKANDYGHSLALDSSNGVFVVGRTDSSRFATNGFTTESGAPAGYAGAQDAFVLKLSTDVEVEPSIPVVSASDSGDEIIVHWAASRMTYSLESRDEVSGEWRPVAQTPVLIEGRRAVVLPAPRSSPAFRLKPARR